MKKIILGIIALVILGGGAYYELVYHPQQYEKGVIRAFEDIQKSAGTSLGGQVTQVTTGPNDFEGALKVVKAQKTVYSELRKNIAGLWPPFFGELRQFHRDVIWWMDKSVASAEDLEKKVIFLARGGKCKEAVSLEGPPNQDNTKVREIQEFFKGKFRNAQTACDEFIQRIDDLPTVGTPSSADLKTAWEGTPAEMDIFLRFVIAQNPESFVRNTTPQLGPRELAAMTKIEKFNKLVNEFLMNNRLSSVAAIDPANIGEDAKAVSERVSKTLDKIKAKHGGTQ